MRCEERLESASRLSDDALAAELARLASSGRATTAALIAHLAEFDVRRLHLSAGFRSLFRYCTDHLRLSEHEAYNRIEAARLAGHFPQVVDRIEEGSLNLTTVRLLAPHLTEDNQEGLLAGAAFKSKGEVLELIARRFPQPAIPSTVHKLPMAIVPETPVPATPIAAGASPVAGQQQQCLGETGGLGDGGGSPAAAANPRSQQVPPGKPGLVRPLAADRYEIRFTATGATREKLRLATDLLRHALPDGDIAEIVDRALDALLEDLARRKFAAVRQGQDTARARAGTMATAAEPGSDPGESIVERPGTRHIPAAVKRAVWLRDGGRCAFVGTKGRRCDAGGFLEFHHLDPHAVGGPATERNIQLRCRAHNAYEADLFYGQHEPTSVWVGRDRARILPQLVPERVAKGRVPGSAVGLSGPGSGEAGSGSGGETDHEGPRSVSVEGVRSSMRSPRADHKGGTPATGM